MSFIKGLFAGKEERERMADERLAAKEAAKKESARARIKEELAVTNQPRATQPQQLEELRNLKELAEMPDMTNELVLIEEGKSDISQTPEQTPIALESQNVPYVIVDGNVITLDKLIRMESAAKRIEWFAKIMDTAGLDALIGLLVGGGDMATAVASIYPVVEAMRLGVPKTKMLIMTKNMLVDLGLGVVPFLGDVIDFFYKANKKNSKIFDNYLIRAKLKYQEIDPEGFARAETMGLITSSRVQIERLLENA